jgi:hypothetical protein
MVTGTVLQKVLHCKKKLEIFPVPSRDVTKTKKLSLAGNKIKGTGTSLSFFSVYGWYLAMKVVPAVSYFDFFAVCFLMLQYVTAH